MIRRKVKWPKIYPEVAPLPTEVPVKQSKLRFARSNVQVFCVFILLKFEIISYPECFKPFSRLEGALGDEKELQFDLTFSVLTIAIACNCRTEEMLGRHLLFLFTQHVDNCWWRGRDHQPRSVTQYFQMNHSTFMTHRNSKESWPA